MSTAVHHGDALHVLPTMEAGSVQTCVTSPPYFGLRDYGVPASDWPDVQYAPMPGLPEVVVPAMSCCLGLEPTPEAFVGHLVAVFREVRRVLRDDGTLWVNIGDSFANDGKWGGETGGKHVDALHGTAVGRIRRTTGLKPKDLLGIPWRVAFALQADGWWLRSDIVWAKGISCLPDYAGSCMPEPVWAISPEPSDIQHYAMMPSRLAALMIRAGTSERGACPHCGSPWERETERVSGGPTTKAEREAEAAVPVRYMDYRPQGKDGTPALKVSPGEVVNRTVDWLPSCDCPPHTPVPCTVLDPFAGAGTTLKTAARLGRDSVGIELHPDHAETARTRAAAVAPLFG